jgi:hypothetical protein
MAKENHDYLVEALESLTDYAAMIKGALGHLRDAGLSEEAAEAVLMSALDIPGWVREPWESEDYEYEDFEEWSEEDDDEAL